MSTQDRRLNKIAEVLIRRPNPATGDIFTVADIDRPIATLEADPNPAFILGIPNAQFAVLVTSETKRIEAQLKHGVDERFARSKAETGTVSTDAKRETADRETS